MKLPTLLFLLTSAASANLSIRNPRAPNSVNVSETTLSNGAVMSLLISEPVNNSATFVLERGLNYTEVTIEGTAGIELGKPDVTYIYVIDTSGSTEEDDGACGSTLDCTKSFIKALHQQAISDGSASLAAVINFDYDARVDAPLQPATNVQAINQAIDMGFSDGDTECEAALQAAADLVTHKDNTARTTVVVFVGDGACDYPPNADILGDVGAIVHTVAVGDNVGCEEETSSYYNTSLVTIPRNGGVCTSVPDPNTLPNIVDDLVGSDLFTLEFQADGAEYVQIPKPNLVSGSLPIAAPAEVSFAFDLDFYQGEHLVCIRATGDDSFGDVDVIENCRQFTVVEPPPLPVATKSLLPSGDANVTIALAVLLPLGVIVIVLAAAKFCRSKSGGSVATVDNTGTMA